MSEASRSRALGIGALVARRDLFARAGWAVVAIGIVGGIVCRFFDLGIVALWLFVAATVAAALVLPLPYALVAPLFGGVFGWLVDMLPFVVLVGWGVVVLRWAWPLVRDRRLPVGGNAKWIWIPIGLFAWTILGAVAVPREDWKHFVLLLGIQFLSSATVLCVADALRNEVDRRRLIAGLLTFVVALTAGVFLQWIGVPLEDLKDPEVGVVLEEAYGVDAFENDRGMIKYARASDSHDGLVRLRHTLRDLRAENPEIPDFRAFQPTFKAYPEHYVIRFMGSARAVEDSLASELDIELVFDNVGLAPGELVPRWRSFPRNALTYAGLCAALFPFALYLFWTGERRPRALAAVALACALLGAGFAIARGAWIAILVAIVYLVVDGVVSRRLKLQTVGIFVAGALALTAMFVALYETDPLRARAGAEASVETRQELYSETVRSLAQPIHFFIGYGTEQSRLAAGGNKLFGQVGRYVPQAGTHSTYLNYFYRAGVVGALGIVALYALAALHARAAARDRRRDNERIYYSVATASVLAIAVHALILSLYVEPIYTLIVSCIIGLALSGATRLERSVWPWRRPAKGAAAG